MQDIVQSVGAATVLESVLQTGGCRLAAPSRGLLLGVSGPKSLCANGICDNNDGNDGVKDFLTPMTLSSCHSSMAVLKPTSSSRFVEFTTATHAALLAVCICL